MLPHYRLLLFPYRVASYAKETKSYIGNIPPPPPPSTPLSIILHKGRVTPWDFIQYYGTCFIILGLTNASWKVYPVASIGSVQCVMRSFFWSSAFHVTYHSQQSMVSLPRFIYPKYPNIQYFYISR